MNEYPEINPGDGMEATSARQWRALSNQVKELHRAVYGDTNTQATASGVRSSPRIPAPLIRFTDKTVVVVRKPVDGDLTVLIREARYKTLPPKPCTGDGDSATCFYEWFGPSFEVYPPLGVKPIAYDGDEYTADPATNPPKLTTKYYRLHREHDAWILDPPAVGGSTTDLCLVHGRAPGTPSWSTPSDIIRIIHMKKNPNYGLVPPDSPPETQPDTNTHIWGGLSADPLGYSLVSCWPGTKQADWEPYLSTNSGFPPVIGTNPVYLTTKMIGGVEYICPEVFVETGAPDSGTLAGDC